MNKGLVISIAVPNEKDLDIFKPAIETFSRFQIDYEQVVTSAHRSPDGMVEYAKGLRKRGIKIVIAAARGAAHLPGMIAAYTTLPVVAVPLKSPFLDDTDSVYSMLHMPTGVPLAVVGVDATENASILAIQILGLFQEEAAKAMVGIKESLAKEVRKQSENIKKNYG